MIIIIKNFVLYENNLAVDFASVPQLILSKQIMLNAKICCNTYFTKAGFKSKMTVIKSEIKVYCGYELN